MRYLILILLFPLFCHSQYAAGIAQYTAENAPKFSVLVNSSILNNTQKAAVASDTLGVHYVRTSISTQQWNGTNFGNLDKYIAKGLKISLVIHYQAQSPDPQPFVTASQLSGYKDTVGLILAVYHNNIYEVVVENEEMNDNYYYGSLADYVNMIHACYDKAHPYGIKVMDGGLFFTGMTVHTYRWVQVKYGQSAADQYGAARMTPSQVNAAKNPGSNPSIETNVSQVDTILTAISYMNNVNIHDYEPMNPNTTRPDTVTQIGLNVWRYQKEAFESLSNIPVISNEVGIRNNTNTSLVTNMMNNFIRLGFLFNSYFDGAGASGGELLTNDATGEILPTGLAFRAVVEANQNDTKPLP